MNFLVGIIVINIVVAGITDMTDWPDTVKKAISRIITKGKISTIDYRIHLVDCSLCQTFWLSSLWILIYWLLTGSFNMWMLIAPIISALLVSNTSEILFFMKDLITYIITKLRLLIR